MHKIITILFLSFLTYNTVAQELNCQVSVIKSPQLEVSATDLEVLKDLEKLKVPPPSDRLRKKVEEIR